MFSGICLKIVGFCVMDMTIDEIITKTLEEMQRETALSPEEIEQKRRKLEEKLTEQGYRDGEEIG